MCHFFHAHAGQDKECLTGLIMGLQGDSVPDF
jgi:hypothetical protein